MLTQVAIKNLRARAARYEHGDAGCPGLRVVVQPSGHKSWCVRYRFRGAPRKLTLGDVLIERGAQTEPDTAPELDTPLSLMSARELATKALRQAKSGTDPAAAKRKKRDEQHAADADTLKAVGAEYLRREGSKLRTVDQRRADLALLYPTLGALPIEQIGRKQFVRVLDHIADKRGPVRADRVLGALSRLLSWHAQRSDFVSPLVRGMRRNAAQARSRVLSDHELRAVWTTAETFPGPFGGYLRFLLLTATRRNEAAGLRRSELLAPDTWLIPAARCKSGRDVLIPLSRAAQKIVAAQPQLRNGNFVFTVSGANGLTSFDRLKRAFDAASGVSGWRIHDLRRTSRTLLSRAGIAADVSERCLGHMLTGVRGVYDRHAYESEKRHAFEALAAQIERIINPLPASVVPLGEHNKR